MEKGNTMEYLFVYGTLGGHPIMKNANFLFECDTVKKYVKKRESFYPYLLEHSEDTPEADYISGKLYEVKSEDMPSIDYYEGVPDLFYREEIDVELENAVFQAQCYFKTTN